jgi:hypothetical protein
VRIERIDDVLDYTDAFGYLQTFYGGEDQAFQEVPLKHLRLVGYVIFVSDIVLIGDREPYGRYHVTPKASRNCPSTQRSASCHIRALRQL